MLLKFRFWVIMDTLKQCWENMSLNDREGGEFQFDEETDLSNCTITAKFLIRQALNTEAIIRTFNPIGSQKMGSRYVMLETIYSYLCSIMKKLRKFSMEPWSFDKHLVMIQ